MKLKNILAAAFLTVALFFFRTALGIDNNGIPSAVQYLKTKTASPWVSMALVAAGESADTEYLKTRTGKSATDYEAPILALTASGLDPAVYPGENFISRLESFFTGGQIGDPNLLNDDIFGILALRSAGKEPSYGIIQASAAFLKKNQNTDGSFSYGLGAGGDTNTAAAAIMALRSAGFSVSDKAILGAVSYLKKSQNEDGGFPYDPSSSYGANSDASSDSWVISAIYALGENPEIWQKNGKNPVSHLKTLQMKEGWFANQAGAGETSFTGTETAYAVIALSGQFYPIDSKNGTAESLSLVDYKIEGSSGVICAGEAGAETPLALISKAAKKCGFTYEIKETDFGPYLLRIGDNAALGINGWLYTVNMLPLEKITAGARDYKLADGDFVLWRFGFFNDPKFSEEKSAVFPLQVAVIGDGNANSGTQSPNEGEFAFTIEAKGAAADSESLFDFGETTAGKTLKKDVSVKNNGSGGLSLKTVVSGDSIFKDGLEIESASWRIFGAVLGSGETKDITVSVLVPSSSGGGVKKGMLTFWASLSGN